MTFEGQPQGGEKARQSPPQISVFQKLGETLRTFINTPEDAQNVSGHPETLRTFIEIHRNLHDVSGQSGMHYPTKTRSSEDLIVPCLGQDDDYYVKSRPLGTENEKAGGEAAENVNDLQPMGLQQLLSDDIHEYDTQTGSPLKVATEDAIAIFLGSDFGYITDTGQHPCEIALSAIMGPSSLILLEERYSSSPIVAACAGQAGCLQRFKANDTLGLERVLKRSKDKYNHIIVLINGLDRTNGVVPPLIELERLRYVYGFVLVCDQTHSFLAIGKTGRGCLEYWNETHPDEYPYQRVGSNLIDLHVGVLSKTDENTVGFICGASDHEGPIWRHIEVLEHAESQRNPVKVPPSTLIQVLWTLLQPTRLERRARRWKAICQHARSELSRFGIFVYGEPEMYVLPIFTGLPSISRALCEALGRRGILATAINAPQVPDWESRVCVSISAELSDKKVNLLVYSVVATARQVGLCSQTTVMAQSLRTTNSCANDGDVGATEAKEAEHAFNVIRDLAKKPVPEVQPAVGERTVGVDND